MGLQSFALLPPAALALRLGLVVPLSVACLLTALTAPLAARRGKLSIPACAGIGIVAAGLALLVGHLAGAHKISGTVYGVALAIAFFLLVSTSVGSFVALFFYREPPEA